VTTIGLNCPIPSSFEQSKDWSQLPDSYSQTPGGTLFSTTPGGNELYDNRYMFSCRSVGIYQSHAPPPCCLPHIPGDTVLALHPLGKLREMDENKDISADDAQFVIDI
uniref:Eukaryotic translation initiation factor 4E binding protein 3 n=1 Tax=Salmo trutta TaxID=8032 RepID=A0A673WTX9_SALTR